MKTALYEQHKSMGAKFISFANWEMPLYYQGILTEHSAVRHKTGIFDVSHMGKINITGKDTLKFLDYLSTNTVLDKPLGKAFYSLFCNEEGKAIDDLMIFPLSRAFAFLIVNAANREVHRMHLSKHQKAFDVSIDYRYELEGILSLQGPASKELLKTLFPSLSELERMQVYPVEDLIISKTGYTGEEGFEIFASNKRIINLWESFFKIAKPPMPCGLGARDLLRQEMGYILYGHELSLDINPLESLASWVVKISKHDFLGKQALQLAASRSNKNYPLAIKGKIPLPAREGNVIYYLDNKIGKVTSGTFSPTLKKPIALALVNQKLLEGKEVQVEIRKNFYNFEIVKLPFINLESSHKIPNG